MQPAAVSDASLRQTVQPILTWIAGGGGGGIKQMWSLCKANIP